jgi:kynurenine formamidase
MKARISYRNNILKIDLSKPIDISIPYSKNSGPLAWYVDRVQIEPVINEHFTGDVTLGGSVNFRNIAFNPHGNGTHTENVGHISKESYDVNQSIKCFFCIAQLITLQPKNMDNGDKIITRNQIQNRFLSGNSVEGLIIRSLPNSSDKKNKNYANTNPPYFEAEALEFCRVSGVKHFITDLPSVDRESDEGKLAAHHKFWNYPDNPIIDNTITELVYVDDSVEDGFYLLELQMAPFENDASPSRPVLYRIEE